MAADEPPYLTVGTDVSAKYKGAFCEAKIKKVNRMVKCKVTFKNNLGSALIPDDQIKGVLRIGADVEARHPEKNQFVDAVINKLQDYSQYTVAFDDGDETTLRRTSLCLKSGRHFAESPTLNQFPLTNPEHFGTPVIGSGKSKRKRRSTINSATLDYDSSDEELHVKKNKISRGKERDPDLGKVVCVEYGDRRKKECWYPGLVVASPLQDNFKINTKEEYLIRSFKDGKYYQVPKKDTREFTPEIGQKVESNTLRTAVEKALLYYEKDELPPHWDKALFMGLEAPSAEEESHDSDSDTPDDEPSEEKDRFVAQLYKFMDERGTPINKAPTVGSRDLNLYKLFKIMHKMGGYNRVTNQNQWKLVYTKMGLPSSNPAGSNQIKVAYKRYLHSFEDFYRKLGCTMVTNSRCTRVRHRSDRNFIITRNRDRDITTAKGKSSNKDTKDKCLGDKKIEEKQKNDESRKTEVRSKNEEAPKSDEKPKSLEKKKSEKPVKAEEKDEKSKPNKKSEEKPRLVRSQSVNKEKKELKNREDDKKEMKPEKARTREDARKEKAESPEKKETRASVKIEQERERREREETGKKEADQPKEKKERLAREKDKREEKSVKKEEKQVKEVTEDKCRDKKEDRLLKDKKDDNKPAREKKDEKFTKDKKEDRSMKDKREEKPFKDKKEERFSKDKKEEKGIKDLPKDKKEEKNAKDLPNDKKEEKIIKDKREEKIIKDKKEEKIIKDKKDEKFFKDKKDEKASMKLTKEEKQSRVEHDSKVKEKTPLKDKKETKLVKEKKGLFPKEREEKFVKKENTTLKEKTDLKSQRKEEKDNGDESVSSFVEVDIENSVKGRNDSDDCQLKQVKKKLVKTEEKEEPRCGLQPNDSDDDDLPLALEKMMDKRDGKEGEIEIGDRVKVKYGRGRMKKVYEAKVLRTDKDGNDRRYYVHYAGWNMRYDEWIRKSSIVENMSEKNRFARKTKQILNAKAQNFLAQVSLKREKGRLPGPLISSKLSRKSSTSSTNSTVSCSRTTRSDKNSLSTSPYSAGLEPRKRARKKSGLSVALTDTSQDSESDIDHMSFDPDDEADELEEHSNHSEINIKQEVLSDIEGEKEAPAGCKKEFHILSENVTALNIPCEFKEIKMEIPLTEEKSPPILSSIDDHKDSDDTMRELYKETVPDIVETKHSDGNVLVMKCEDNALCTDPMENLKKNSDDDGGDLLEKEPVENQSEDGDSLRTEHYEDLDVQQASTSKPNKKCNKLMDSFMDLPQSTVKLLTSKTLTKTLNVAIKDIASEYDFDTWNEISEKKDSIKLYDASLKESATSISCAESDDERMDVGHECPVTEHEIKKDDKFSESEILGNKDVVENKNISELVGNAEKIDTFKNECILSDFKRLVEIDREEASCEMGTKGDENICAEEETVCNNESPIEHLNESCSVDILDDPDITEDSAEGSKPEEKIPTVDVCKYENLAVIDDSTVEKSDEEFKTDNEFDIKDKPCEISNASDKVCMPHTEGTDSPKTDVDKHDTSSNTLPPVEKELMPKQKADPCGLLPALEILNCSSEIHDICTDLPIIDEVAKKAQSVQSENFNICTEEELKREENDNDASDDYDENDNVREEHAPKKLENICIMESKDPEKMPVISSTVVSEVCSSESLQTSAVALAAAVATSVATAVPLSSPFSEGNNVPCIPAASEAVEIVAEVPCEATETIKSEGKPPERSIEQKFVEVVFQNLEKRSKFEGEETTGVNADIKSPNPVFQFPCNEEKQDLSSGTGNDSIIKENIPCMDNTIHDATKDGAYEAEDLSKPKVYDMVEEKEVTAVQERDFSCISVTSKIPPKVDLNLNTDKLTIFEESPLKSLGCNFMRSLGEVADMFLESHNVSEANKDLNTNQSDMSAISHVLKKESKKKKTKLSKQEKKMSGVDFLDREEGKSTKSKSKKKRNEHDDFEKSRDPELKTKSKKLKKNKNKKKLSKHEDTSGDLWKKIEGKDEDNTEKVRKKDKRKREEKKINRGDSKNEDSWEVKVLDSLKKEKKKGKKKDRLSSEKRAELFEKRAKKKKKLHMEDNFDSDSEKDSRLSRKEKKREKKKVKSKDSSSSDDCTDRLVKDLPFEQPENLNSFGSQLIIPSTYQRQDSARSEDPDMSFLLCKEKVPASPEDVNTVPEDTSNSSVMEENNSLAGQASSDSEKIEPAIMDAFPRHEGLEPAHRHDTEACAVLDNTPPTTPSSTESLLSSSPSHERESYALHYPESTRSGRESAEGESDSLQCEPTGIEVTDSEEYRAAATLAFAVCKSVPEKPKEASRVSLKRQKSECDDLSPAKHRKKSKRYSLCESSKHGRHKSVSRTLGGDDDYDSSGANSMTTVTSPVHSSSSVQNASITPASSQHLITTQAVTTHTPARPSKFNFYVPLDDYKDADKRIAVIQEKLSELKRTYMSLKAEVALIDRRRKKAKKKEKEAGPTTSNSSSHLEEVHCSS